MRTDQWKDRPFIGRGVEEHRKIGWTIRPSLSANSAHVTAAEIQGARLMTLEQGKPLAESRA